MKKINVLAAFLFITGIATAQTTWNLDKAHTNIQFNVTHMVVSEVKRSLY
ncbi:MAG: hypothetical protein IPK96_14880 [Flammeovirgaceae bacterium]|nr:hypothetical protein [Flammeovirgaceae bacterium]